MHLGNRRVLLTGASGGLGMAIATALYRRGAVLVLTARRVELLEQLRDALGDKRRVELAPADLSKRADVVRLGQEYGEIDVLVANAGLPASGRLEDIDPDMIDRAIDVNLRGAIQLSRALLPGMLARRRGHLVYVSSIAGKVASPQSCLYSATKFGLRGFALGLGEDLRDSGVGVTTVFPGFIRDAGMFADTKVTLPRAVGTSSPEEVGSAVVRGIEQNKAEINVAPIGVRAIAVAAAVAPLTSASMQRRLGSHRVAAQIAGAQTDKG